MLQPGQLLHIYNQGNNREQVFFHEENYSFFLEKIKGLVLPTVDILAYCLMPNHFHFLVYTNQSSCQNIKVGSLQLQRLTNAFRSVQSSYAQAINKQQKRSGSLFRQRTKMKVIENEPYGVICFHYIHQNPMKAGLVRKIEDWQHSSFGDYCGLRKHMFCNQSLAENILAINKSSLYEDSYKAIDDDLLMELL